MGDISERLELYENVQNGDVRLNALQESIVHNKQVTLFSIITSGVHSFAAGLSVAYDKPVYALIFGTLGIASAVLAVACSRKYGRLCVEETDLRRELVDKRCSPKYQEAVKFYCNVDEFT